MDAAAGWSLRLQFWRLSGFFAVALIWQSASSLKLLNPALVPTPADTLSTFFRLVLSGEIAGDAIATLARTATGYFLAAAIGMSAGILLGYYAALYRATADLLDFFRSIPVTTLYPVFVLVVGIGDVSKIAMVFWACVWIVMLNSAYGVLQTRQVRRQMAILLGASQSQVLRWIVFYDALPQTFVGLRVALSLALVVELLCEMFQGSNIGLGQRITEAYTTYAMPRLWALIIVAGAFGLLLNKLFLIAERKAIPWAAR